MRNIALFVIPIVASASLAQTHYLDHTGTKEWRLLNTTTGLSWNQVASICPTDGSTPCQGVVGGKDLTGWVWATPEQVRSAMQYFNPDLTPQFPCISSPQYVLMAMNATGSFGVTGWSVSTYQSSYSSVGWNASAPMSGYGGVSLISATLGQHDGWFCATSSAPATNNTTFRGVWLWRPVGCDLATPTSSPAHTSACAGQTAVMTVTATSPTPMTYQWRKNRVPINPAQHPSASTATLTCHVYSPADAGQYDCVITNSCGSVVSGAATLTVQTSGCCDSIDFNQDGLFPDANDVNEFLSVFSGGACSTPACNDIDFNNDGLSPDAGDLDAFLSVFSGGSC